MVTGHRSIVFVTFSSFGVGHTINVGPESSGRTGVDVEGADGRKLDFGDPKQTKRTD